MNATERMVKHTMATVYEYYLEVGEDALLREIAGLPEEELSVYPGVKARIGQQEKAELPLGY